MALGDGIGRNKGRKGYAFQEGYNTAITEFAERLKEVCEKNPTAIDRKTGKPLYGKDGVWQDLIDDITEELRGAE